MMLRIAGIVALTLLTGCAGDDTRTDVARSVDEPTAADTSVVTYTARGVVKSITPKKTHMVIVHDDIEGFMSAMTMPFALRDSALAAGVNPGDTIDFAIEVAGYDIEITGIEHR